MSRTIKTAAIQMDANPAPTEERLARAQKLVEEAARAGADLVVLPELFNTGYQYTPANYRLAEPADGRTVTWLRDTAARLNIHLAGSLMLLDANEVFNALFLFAPDGRFWRYDKNYPWGWERGYFRDASRITIAMTDLGDFGMLICWDSAHRDLWRQYAGQVDMMLIASCPPDVSNPTYLFPDGRRVTADELGPVMKRLKGNGRRVFGDMINQQTAWLGVPAVNTVGCGQITTPIPAGTATLLSFLLLAPRIAQYLPQAGEMQMQCQMVQGCKIVAADGAVITALHATFLDNATGNMVVALQTRTISGTLIEIASVSSSGASVSVQTATTNAITEGVVDNFTRGYHLRVFSSNWPGNLLLRIFGVRIEYTVDEVQ